MRKTLIATALAVVCVVPAGAVAKPSSTDKSNAAKECKSLRTAMGPNFATTFGTNEGGKNAFGKCVSRQSRDEEQERESARSNASKECKAERTTDKAAFNAKYRNLGKCVSERAKEKKAKADKADRERVSASKQCRSEQKADADKFKADYGTSRNAFGKCVSAKAKAQNDDQEQESTPAS